MFGGLEGPGTRPGQSPVFAGFGRYNGFWEDYGDYNYMVDTMIFSGPPIGSPYDDELKWTGVLGADVCAAASTAERVYTTGYRGVGHNSLDATYDVLNDYGATPLPRDHGINSVPNIWYNNLNWFFDPNP